MAVGEERTFLLLFLLFWLRPVPLVLSFATSNAAPAHTKSRQYEEHKVMYKSYAQKNMLYEEHKAMYTTLAPESTRV